MSPKKHKTHTYIKTIFSRATRNWPLPQLTGGRDSHSHRLAYHNSQPWQHRSRSYQHTSNVRAFLPATPSSAHKLSHRGKLVQYLVESIEFWCKLVGNFKKGQYDYVFKTNFPLFYFFLFLCIFLYIYTCIHMCVPGDWKAMSSVLFNHSTLAFRGRASH